MDGFLFPIGDDAVEAGSSKQTIAATAHSARAGDVIFFTSGNRVGLRARVRSVAANSIITVESFNIGCEVGDTFQIFRQGVVRRTFANIAASQTDAALVAASSGKLYRVLGYILHAGDTAGSDFTFNSKPAGAGVAISALHNQGINQVTVAPETKCGWFDCVRSEGLTCTTGAGSTTGVEVIYAEL